MDYGAMLEQLLANVASPTQAQVPGGNSPGYNQAALLNAMQPIPKEDPIQKRLTGWKGFLQKMKEQPELLEALNVFGGALAQGGDWRSNAGQGLMLFQQTLSEAKKKKLMAEQAAQKDKLEKTQLLLQARNMDLQEGRQAQDDSNARLDRTIRILQLGNSLEQQKVENKRADKRLSLDEQQNARADKSAKEQSEINKLQKKRLLAELNKPEGLMPIGQGYSQVQNLAASIFNSELEKNPKLDSEGRIKLFEQATLSAAQGLSPKVIELSSKATKGMDDQILKNYYSYVKDLKSNQLVNSLSDEQIVAQAAELAKKAQAGAVGLTAPTTTGEGTPEIQSTTATTQIIDGPLKAKAETVANSIRASGGTVLSVNGATGEIEYLQPDKARKRVNVSKL